MSDISYLLLVKMLPLRAEVGFSPPALHPCGHLSNAVHPGARTRTVSGRQKEIKTRKHVQARGNIRALAHYLERDMSCVFIAGDAPRLMRKSKVNVCLMRYGRGGIRPQGGGHDASSCLLPPTSSYTHTHTHVKNVSITSQISVFKTAIILINRAVV